ncbi:hypothetical protein KVP09_06420 [Alcaligenaceae bacterium CGII-47]|nr:hypothetical protein [Alcaligenaceae bacterium CGII-47]
MSLHISISTLAALIAVGAGAVIVLWRGMKKFVKLVDRWLIPPRCLKSCGVRTTSATDITRVPVGMRPIGAKRSPGDE